MKKYICDKCEKEIDVSRFVNLKVERYSNAYSTYIPVDLCEKCERKIIQLINGGKNNERSN